MSREGALWIGGLETYMDEDFILKAMHSMGETNILSIKVIIIIISFQILSDKINNSCYSSLVQ